MTPQQVKNARAVRLGFETAYHQREARRIYKDEVGVAAKPGSTRADLLDDLRNTNVSPKNFRKAMRFAIDDQAAWTNILSA